MWPMKNIVVFLYYLFIKVFPLEAKRKLALVMLACKTNKQILCDVTLSVFDYTDAARN